ncbi:MULTISPECIES: DUF983 domain-containing protein [unclassified Phenylobacterium]|uniref:DUF983 domain-containing protein n=1 Tax=unclassified Phenylobacterium TaxID=2640670 RepID=UPI002263BB9C|nr:MULTISPECIES: DUF983 domain-containing protein [unclassified Phenylobacterium]MBS0489228.1 DUF983 domain-containing protein [Pseudomonadota bacterium]MCX7588514.1 DUF983 domain-containing protein [Phenylobacterium sp. 58.2.17]WGU41571.1 DUF983 domain-containing protein [Phenylobacterium sp. NIBR 498073]
MADANQTYDPPLPIISGLTCRCPRCGKGKLFSGFLKMAPSCEACGLDFSFADPADGPAFFVMTAIGMIVIAVFTWVEVAYHPPMWVHMVTVFPALIIGCLGTLRPVKAWLVASQFFHKAEEARFSSLGGHGEGGFGLRGKARDRAA